MEMRCTNDITIGILGSYPGAGLYFFKTLCRFFGFYYSISMLGSMLFLSTRVEAGFLGLRGGFAIRSVLFPRGLAASFVFYVYSRLVSACLLLHDLLFLNLALRSSLLASGFLPASLSVFPRTVPLLYRGLSDGSNG